MLSFIPIEEADDALEVFLGVVPVFSRDPQPAGDSVEITVQLGSTVSRHIFVDFLPINLPWHTNMVWVEPTGHTK